MGEGSVGGGAEDDADGRVFALVSPVLAGVVAAEEHLAGVGVGVGAELEVDDDEAGAKMVASSGVRCLARRFGLHSPHGQHLYPPRTARYLWHSRVGESAADGSPGCEGLS